MPHQLERALARALRRARCAPLPVLAVMATGGLLPSIGLPPLLSAHPAAPAVERAQPAAAAAAPAALERALRAEAAPSRPARASRDTGRVSSAPAHRWVRPSGGALTSRYGMRWGKLHKGIDLGASYGSPIYAATDGVITYAGPEGGYGRLILIRDWDGTVTAYGHMSRYAKTSGRVRAGDVIAYVGSAGDATGPHLHFEVRIGSRPIDPLAFLRKRGVRI